MQLRFTVFKDNQRGILELTDNEITLQVDRAFHIRTSYVERIEKTGELGLDRVGVKLDYFDLFGNKETLLFAMHESEFRSLKKTIGK